MLKSRILLVGALGFLGCGDDNRISSDVNLPKPDKGFQLVVPPFEVIPNSEVQDCYYFKAPIDAPMDVHRMEVALNPGSHHMNLFRYVGSTDPGHQDGDIVRGCWDAVAFE